jgi:glutathione synthase/RimK-type ligase-like ATP-grasp enzyme
MKHIKLFEEFIHESFQLNENAQDSCLKKIYLATRRDSGQRWWSYKGFAGNKFFIQVTENNIDTLDINPNYPILNYHSSIVNELLEKGKIKNENVYNHPKWIHLSGSKEEFHKLVGEDENVPKTVYSKNEALEKLTFPIIAKPANGHSGIGIQVIKKPELMEDIDEDVFDTFSEYVDKVEEMRFFTFKGEPIFWMERTPVNSKAKTGDGDANEQMHFKYARRNIQNIPEEYQKVLEKYCKIFEKFPYICFDMMKDKSGKVFVIESNSQPGVPFDSTVQIYKKIYEDFYRTSIDEKSNKKLDEFASHMIERTLLRDKERFSIKD